MKYDFSPLTTLHFINQDKVPVLNKVLRYEVRENGGILHLCKLCFT